MSTVDAAIGLDCSSLSMTPSKGYWSSYMLHSLKDGVFKEIYLSDRAKKYIVEQDIYVKLGDKVFKFSRSHHTLGTMILQYSTLEEMMDMLDHMEKDIKVVVE